MWDTSKYKRKILMENEMKEYHPISVGNWVITLIVTWIPLVNIVMLLVWAFSKNTHPSKSNFAKANLLFIVFFLIFFIALMFTRDTTS
jgi:hypothetical protein